MAPRRRVKDDRSADEKHFNCSQSAVIDECIRTGSLCKLRVRLCFWRSNDRECPSQSHDELDKRCCLPQQETVAALEPGGEAAVLGPLPPAPLF